MPELAPSPPYRVLGFSDLPGWETDDHAAALSVFLKSADTLTGPEWHGLADTARRAANPRLFFEDVFMPVEIGDINSAKITGYYEPELYGALRAEDGYTAPIYRTPPDLQPDTPWLTRREIEETGRLAGRGLELAWLDDPVDVFFLHVQGSGRIRLPSGQTLRVGFAARNNHPYRSIGAYLIENGKIDAARVTAQAIKAWLRKHPDEGREVMWHNESFVFFKEIDTVSPQDGPIGTLGCPVTAMRSVAVDPAFTPLGAPVWIDCETPRPIRRLTVAQDTGSAIKGAGRIDIFVGTGSDAGRTAGSMNHPGRVVTLLPKCLVT